MKARLITKDGKHVATLELEPNLCAPVMLSYQGRTFHIDNMLVGIQYREFTKEDLDRMRKYSVWKQGTEHVVIPADRDPRSHFDDAHASPPTLVRHIEAETWEDAMADHHRAMGWEPYKAMPS